MVTRSGWVAGKYGWPESTLPSLVPRREFIDLEITYTVLGQTRVAKVNLTSYKVTK
jgi:hypothetical protein